MGIWPFHACIWGAPHFWRKFVVITMVRENRHTYGECQRAPPKNDQNFNNYLVILDNMVNLILIVVIFRRILTPYVWLMELKFASFEYLVRRIWNSCHKHTLNHKGFIESIRILYFFLKVEENNVIKSSKGYQIWTRYKRKKMIISRWNQIILRGI